MNDKLTEIFLYEANDLIADLERSILLLENDLQNKEAISAIFRSMHTLKSSCGMFGFDAMTTLTHHLESIYQAVRDGSRTMDEVILQVTLKTLDQLRVLLSSPRAMASSHDYNELLATVRALETREPQRPINREVPINAVASTYYIYIIPNADVFKKGHNPLYLIDDLFALGPAYSFPFFHDIPDLKNISVSVCYIGFEVVLRTEKTIHELNSVFLFAENACTIRVQRIGDGNTFEAINVEEPPFAKRDLHGPMGVATIQTSLLKNVKTAKERESGVTIDKHKAASIRVNTENLDDLMNLVSELVTTQARLSLFSSLSRSQELAGISENIEKITRRLRDNAFGMSLVTVDTLVVRFQRLVSDLSKTLGKSIEFKTEGVDTKIDKSIIEKLTDPILHLLRNCIDHGIEHPLEREKKGKPRKGVVQLKAYYSGSNVVIEIGDDGGGLDLQRIKAKAIHRGLVDNDTQFSDKELMEFIFLPGFSTASTITDVSGRGVGMDVVKKNIADLRGEIEVETAHGKGTRFLIKLPLTLSILDGLLVRIGKTDFVLPLTAVTKCFEVETARIESSYNPWITLDGVRTPFLFLRRKFGITDDRPDLSQVINIPFNDSHVGIVVDRIVGEYQAVLKSLGRFYHAQDEFSGATILGDGSVALVLDPNKLVRNLSGIDD